MAPPLYPEYVLDDLIVHCTLYSVYCILHTVYGTLCSVLYILYTVYVASVRIYELLCFTLYNANTSTNPKGIPVQCTPDTLLRTLFTGHFTTYNVR